MPPVLTVGLGWARGTVRGRSAEELLDTLADVFGAHREREGGTRWYGRSAQLADGQVLVAWDGIGQASGTVLVDVHQAALDGLGWEGAAGLLAALDALGWRPSRLDLYGDDRQVLATPGTVWDALGAGQAVTHAQRFRRVQDSEGGYTTYLGDRSSDRMLRVYAKPDELGPRVRWELELKGDASRAALASLLALHAAVGVPPLAQHERGATAVGRTSAWTREPSAAAAALVLGLVLDFVDFRDRAADDRHGSRAPRLLWWARMLGETRRARLAVGARVDSLERRIRWLARQVAPTLALAWAREGDGWLNGLLTDGLDRVEATGLGRLAWQGS